MTEADLLAMEKRTKSRLRRALFMIVFQLACLGVQMFYIHTSSLQRMRIQRDIQTLDRLSKQVEQQTQQLNELRKKMAPPPADPRDKM